MQSGACSCVPIPERKETTASPVTIRVAQAGEIDALLELGVSAHRESVFSALPFDRERAERACREMTGAAGSKTILVAEKAGRAVGLLAATADHHFFSSAVGATCLMFYVQPDHRGGLAAVKLLHSFKRWAKVHGASRLYIHVTSGLHVRRTDKMLRRLGFKQTGGNYAFGVSEE